MVSAALGGLDSARTARPAALGPEAGADDIAAAGAALIAVTAAAERLDAAVRATALSRVAGLLGGGHGLGHAEAARVMDLADRLSVDRPADWTDRQRFGWLARAAGVRTREDARVPIDGSGALRPVAGLLSLAAGVFDDPAAGLAGLAEVIDMRRLADVIRTAPADDGGVRGRDVTLDDLRDEFRRLRGLPATAAVTTGGLREQARQARLAKAAQGRVIRRVTRAGLRDQAAIAGWLGQARRYLDAEPGADLTGEQRSALIGGLLDGRPPTRPLPW